MSKTYLAIAFLAVALLGTIFFTWPKYQEFNSLRRNIEIKGQELRSKTDYFDHIKEVAKELEAYEESLSKISSALPGDPFLPATFNFLQNTASQSGLVLGEINVGAISTLEGKPVTGAEEALPSEVKAINLTIGLAGSYQSLKSFLAEVESSARIIEVKSIQFETPEEDEPFSFNLEILVYYY